MRTIHVPARRLAVALALAPVAWGAAAGPAPVQAAASSSQRATAAANRGVAPLPSVELNSASLVQLMALPGIRAEDARRIVQGRPYLSKTDLATRDVLPTGVYLAIRKRVYVRAAVPATRQPTGSPR